MSAMPDRPDLDELERLLAEGTSGPWRDVGCVGELPVSWRTIASGTFGMVAADSTADAALIAAAVNALPFLLAEARKAETLREALRQIEEAGTTMRQHLHPIPPWGDGHIELVPELDRQAFIAHAALGAPE